MKNPSKSLKDNHLKKQMLNSGFAMMEIILTLVLIGIIGVNIMILQRSSWKRTGSSNRLLVAGQLIEKQVEALRMGVDANPASNFPPQPGTISENGVTLSWEFSEVNHLKGSVSPQPNVRQCNLTAWWGSSRGDTMKVTTYLSKNF